MNAALQKILDKQYDPPGRIDLKYRNNEITLITNSDGYPVTMFIGKRKSNGDITGERYVRNSKFKNGSERIHWDRKGKV